MQKFAAEIEVSEEVATYEIPWDSFKKFERETDEEHNIPSNGMVLITSAMPETGLNVGRVDWLAVFQTSEELGRAGLSDCVAP